LEGLRASPKSSIDVIPRLRKWLATSHEQAAQAVPVKATQDVDLVEFTLVARHAAIMARASCETDELMGGLFHDKGEVRRIVRAENPVPLSLTEGHWRPTTVCLTEGLNVQCRESGNVAYGRVAQVKGHLRCRWINGGYVAGHLPRAIRLPLKNAHQLATATDCLSTCARTHALVVRHWKA
jgi:hypothetical protein